MYVLHLGLEDDREFPVEILPYLFLGNAANSEDQQALAKHSIQVKKICYIHPFFSINCCFSFLI